MDFCTSKGRKRNSTRPARCCRGEDFTAAEQSVCAASLHPGKGGITQWLEQVMHSKESGERGERAALVLRRVIILSQRSTLKVRRATRVLRITGSCLLPPGPWVRGAGAEGRAGSPVLCLLPCLCSTGSPFLKVWKEILCKFFPKPPNQAASQGFNPAQRTEHTEPGRIRPCLSLYPSPALLEQ